jgi:endonuclease/exonuclease/phosphatase family metal-dependent hydrolase
MRRVRLLTFNIAHGRGLAPIQGLTSRRKIKANLARIARLIKQVGADIVAFQEIDQDSRWAGSFDHLDYLKDLTGFPHAAFGVNNRRGGLLHLHYGNALLSRHPILHWENFAFGSSRLGEKGFLFAEIDVHGQRVPLVNLHLHYRSRVKRFRQLDRLLEVLDVEARRHGSRWGVPPIVCGDFNTPGHTNDATASLVRHLHRFGSYSLHPLEGATFPSPLPTRRLDFVMLPEGCRAPFSETLPVLLSDHRPVLVEFCLAVRRSHAG